MNAEEKIADLEAENAWLCSVLPNKTKKLAGDARLMFKLVKRAARRACQIECSGNCVFCDAHAIISKVTRD